MKRRGFLKGSGAALAALALTGRPAMAGGWDRPDVVFIVLDDLSPARLGCYGNPACRTPNMDRLAGEGIRFTEMHTHPVCCPSRTALSTGLSPEVTRVYSNGDAQLAKEVINGTANIPQHFRRSPYRTVRFNRFEHSNMQQFWDRAEWVGNRPGLPPKKSPSGGPDAEKDSQFNAFSWGGTGWGDLDDLNGVGTSRAMEALKQDRERPLFLALGLNPTHIPFRAPHRYFEMYDPADVEVPKNPGSGPDGWPLPGTLEELQEGPYWYGMLHGHAPRSPQEWREAIAAHYAVTTYSDALVGYVLHALEDCGRADNTVVIVWSDHGFQLGEHYKWRKGMLRDASTRSVLLMRAPGMARPGTVCRRPVQVEDFFPTLCDLCNIPIPDGLHGVSMQPLLAEPERSWRRGVMHYRGGGDRGLVTDRWRYNRYVGHPEWTELFDQQNDPEEFNNLAHEPEYGSVVGRLDKLMEGGWRATLPG